jgi:8-oxo-dGTP diphosphatase
MVHMGAITVVAAVIRRDGHYLICQRPLGKRHGSLWEFPGGKLQDGETITDAVRRELIEELHVEPLRVGEVRARISDPGSSFVIHFVDVEIAGEPRSVEHDQVAWVEAADLLRYPFAPSDLAFVRSLTASADPP